MAARKRVPRWLRRWLVHPLEAALFYGLYGLFRLLPLDAASAVAGAVGRRVGPLLPLSRRAHHNLDRALPGLATAQRRRIVAGMWENLGRVLGEHPHLAELWDGRIETAGLERLSELIAPGRPCLFFSAHLANWEVLPMAGERFGVPLTAVYRRPNNPLLDPLVRAGRRLEQGSLAPKGKDGARQIVAALSRGGAVAMLVDQKMNDGIPVPFFGRDAMTAPAVALLAQKFDCPIVPVRIERLGGARFRLSLCPPLTRPASGDRAADVRETMARINGVLEGWIRDRPDQWLWLHRRWPD